jgi:hypothetical protein
MLQPTREREREITWRIKPGVGYWREKDKAVGSLRFSKSSCRRRGKGERRGSEKASASSRYLDAKRIQSLLCSGLVDGRPHARHGPRRCRACRSNHKVRRAGGRALEERIQDRHGNEALAPRMGGAGERKQSKASELRKRGVGIARRSGADPRPRATWVQRAGRGGGSMPCRRGFVCF